jgi:hypothetical protein
MCVFQDDLETQISTLYIEKKILCIDVVKHLLWKSGVYEIIQFG